MKVLLKILIILVLLALTLGLLTIWRNGVAWSEPPGFWTRIAVYTMRNVAETRPKHQLPELRPQTYNAPPNALYEHARASILALGWRIEDFDPVARHIHALVTTPILKFTDDFHVTVNSDSSLTIRSSSRFGRADYGANLGHVLKFQRALGTRVAAKSNHSGN